MLTLFYFLTFMIRNVATDDCSRNDIQSHFNLKTIFKPTRNNFELQKELYPSLGELKVIAIKDNINSLILIIFAALVCSTE